MKIPHTAIISTRGNSTKGAKITVQGGAGLVEENIRYGWNYALLLKSGPGPEALWAKTAGPTCILGSEWVHATDGCRGYLWDPVAVPALRHRVGRSFEAEAEGLEADQLLTRVLDEVPEVEGRVAAELRA